MALINICLEFNQKKKRIVFRFTQLFANLGIKPFIFQNTIKVSLIAVEFYPGINKEKHTGHG